MPKNSNNNQSNAPGFILVVEDQEVNRELLVSYFRAENYLVDEAQNGDEAEGMLSKNSYDVVLLDIILPGIDGLTLTRQFRAASDIGIILVTNKSDDIDRIVGLELGADDYITKPFNSRELLARTKNLIRRVRRIKSCQEDSAVSESLKKKIRCGNWILHVGRRTIEKDQAKRQLTEGEFCLLMVFIDNAGNVMTRDQLMNKMHGQDWYAIDRSIDVLVGRLRKKLDDNASSPEYISTAHGSGYIFIADISRLE